MASGESGDAPTRRRCRRCRLPTSLRTRPYRRGARPANEADQLLGGVGFQNPDLLVADELHEFVMVVAAHPVLDADGEADGLGAPGELDQVVDGRVVLGDRIGALTVRDEDADGRRALVGHLVGGELLGKQADGGRGRR